MALHLAAQVWPPPWLPQWSGLQGNNFLSIFRGLLQLSPSLRWLPQLVQCSVFGKLLPTVLPGQMLSMANGSRGATSVIQGSVEDTLLSWLQQDPAWSGLFSKIGTAGKDNAERKVKLEMGLCVAFASCDKELQHNGLQQAFFRTVRVWVWAGPAECKP